MLKFGFELEGFYAEGVNSDISLTILIPPKEYPTDGFPGLVEFRSSGGKSLNEAYAAIIIEMMKYKGVLTSIPDYTFTAKQRAELRRRHEVKSAWNVQNMYGQDPKLLGNRTIASLQINISNLLRPSYTDDKGVFHTEKFGLLDIPRIVRALDEEFKSEIREAKRQMGEYCVKDDTRLEYRSLPNFVFPTQPMAAKEFLDRIEKCINS